MFNSCLLQKKQQNGVEFPAWGNPAPGQAQECADRYCAIVSGFDTLIARAVLIPEDY